MPRLPSPHAPARSHLLLIPLLAVAGWLSGLAVDTGLAGALVLPDDAALATPLPAAGPPDVGSPGVGPDAVASAPRELRPPAPRRADFVDPVAQRSIFDSSKVGVSEEELAADGEVLSDLDLVLLATVVAEPDHYSSALIAKQGQRKVRRRRGKKRVLDDGIDDATGFGLGDEVFGKATLVAIEPGKVVLERGGAREVLRIGPPDDDEAPKGVAAARPAADDDGIEKLGKDHYVVDREAIDRLAENPAALSRLGRATPHRSGGEVDGYRLARIRKGSLGRKLGLRSGDVVHSISGHSLTSMNEAMTAWQSLQDASELEVQLTRRNKQRTIRVEIR